MKNKIAILIMLGGTAFTSCDKYLDETPDNRTELDSKEKISKLLVSAYPNTSFAELAELSSDNTDQPLRSVEFKL